MSLLASHSMPAPLRKSSWRWVFLIVVPLTAILCQVKVPLFFSQLRFLDLPLLVTVYFAMRSGGPIGALLLGAGIGILQDALSGKPLGMFGMAKTLVGFAAALVAQHVDFDVNFVRFVVALVFLLGHHLLYWVLSNSLLGQPMSLEPGQTLVFGLLNAAVAVPLFGLLDRCQVSHA